MSWTANVRDVTTDEISEAVRAVTSPPFMDFAPEGVKQFDAAMNAIQGIIASGALGEVDRIHVDVSCHYNPGHDQTPGYSNDTVMVRVSKADATQP